MIRALLVAQLRHAWQSWTLRALAMGVAVVLAATFVTTSAIHPAQLVERFAWTQLLIALVAGGCFVGWRVAQFPKSRAAEFYLVTPASDWQIVMAQIVGGVFQATLLVGVSVPFVAGMWGAGWIRADEAFALLAVPGAASLLSGIGLAAVAYEPLWVRRLGERLLIGVVLAYLVLLGLFGGYVLPWFLNWRSSVSLEIDASIREAGAAFRYLNPFRLLETVGDPAPPGLAVRVVVVVCLLGAISLACFWRLSRRLRRHYLEENYGRPHGKKEYAQRIADNPLSWWTVRRVSRFKGNVNLYLAWITIALYSAWLLFADRWPQGVATRQLQLIERYGGEALLAAAALHLAVVPAMFLAGLWDSNSQERVGRLELLLVTPLSPRQFLSASVVAAWTRGRGYVLGALMMWIAAVFASRITAFAALGLCLMSAIYIVLCFAAAFRNFARLNSDRTATLWATAWSIGLPALTIFLFAAGRPLFAVLTPLGSVYFLALPAVEKTRLIAESGLSPVSFAWLHAATMAAYVGVSLALLRSALNNFDQEIREWFAEHLVSRAAASSSK